MIVVVKGEYFWGNRMFGRGKTDSGKLIVANWLTRGSINTKRNGGYAQSWQPIGREK